MDSRIHIDSFSGAVADLVRRDFYLLEGDYLESHKEKLGKAIEALMEEDGHG